MEKSTYETQGWKTYDYKVAIVDGRNELIIHSGSAFVFISLGWQIEKQKQQNIWISERDPNQDSVYTCAHIFAAFLKAPYSSKIDIFFIQERFNKLIYVINTVIKCGIWQHVKFH